jgi:hypothetical protein
VPTSRIATGMLHTTSTRPRESPRTVRHAGAAEAILTCGFLGFELEQHGSQAHALQYAPLAIAMKPGAFTILCGHAFLRNLLFETSRSGWSHTVRY